MTTERLCPKCNAPEFSRYGNPAGTSFECGYILYDDGVEDYADPYSTDRHCLRNQLAATLARAEEAEAKVRMVESLPKRAYLVNGPYGWAVIDGYPRNKLSDDPWQALEAAKEAQQAQEGGE
jgi:hypothetical protein